MASISLKGWRGRANCSTRVTRRSMMSYMVSAAEMTRVAASSITSTIHPLEAAIDRKSHSDKYCFVLVAEILIQK